MKNTLETRLGAFVALTLIAGVIVIEMAGGLEFFKEGRLLHGRFDAVQELKEGDPVKLAGVQIGRVVKINPPTENKVEIIMRVEPKRSGQVKTDSQATIKFAGLLGQNFVAISFGSATAPTAADGAILETTEQPDLAGIMQKLDTVATGVESLATNFNFGNLTDLLGPMTDFVKQNSPNLSLIISNAQIVSHHLAEGQGTVGKLIKDDALYEAALGTVTNLNQSAQALSSEFKGIFADLKEISTEVKTVASQAKTTISQINEGQGTIGKLIKDETLYKETTVAMTNLREILEKINRGQGSAGKLVNDESLYRNAKLTLQKLEKATEGLEDQGPLSVLGTVVNSLF